MTTRSASPAAVRQLSDEVVRLTRTSHALRTSAGARGDGVEWAGLALLVQLIKEGPQRTSSLADLACVDPSTVSRQVGSLVRAGYVERLPDPDDGRAALLQATAAGADAVAAMRIRREQAFAVIVADWPDDDVRALAALLDRLNDSFLARRDEVLRILAAGGAPTLEKAR